MHVSCDEQEKRRTDGNSFRKVSDPQAKTSCLQSRMDINPHVCQADVCEFVLIKWTTQLLATHGLPRDPQARENLRLVPMCRIH